MFKQMTLRDRVIIQNEIDNNPRSTLASVADKISVSTSSLYRELKRNRICFGSRSVKFNKSRSSLHCAHLKRFPYCCNACRHRPKCTKEIWEYDAVEAQGRTNYVRSSSRSVVSCTPQQLVELDQKISPRIKNGQSIHHVLVTDPTINYSSSTIRRYIDKGLLTCRNVDLPFTVRFRYKKPSKVSQRQRIDIELLVNRTYEDYRDYSSTRNRTTLQIDLMIGKRNDKIALLTLFEPVSKIQWGVLINRNAFNVNQVLETLIKQLKEKSRLFFDCILADNGAEFQKLPYLEVNKQGEFLVRVFYCDPYTSYQKGGCEKNHALVRRMIKKGESFSLYSQQTIDTIFSNLNSHKRSSLGNLSPFEKFYKLFGFHLTQELNLDEIPPQEIILK